jgi:glycosyltransferase involved in cell wall biosynthesis
MLGADLFMRARAEVPLDHVGMDAEAIDGLGEVLHKDLPAFEARYLFFFNPIRYTSLPLAVCEAMAVGLPVAGLVTTEMATAIRNGVSGYVDTDLDRVIALMKELLRFPEEARRLGEGARRAARKHFGIGRFVRDWDRALRRAVGVPVARAYDAA